LKGVVITTLYLGRNNTNLPDMKINTVSFLALFSILTFGCGERKADSNAESINAQDEVGGQQHKGDTSMVKRDGTLLEGAVERMDSVSLPEPVLRSIEEDPSLAADRIISNRRYTEGSRVLFEVKFSTATDETRTVVFDEKGKKEPDR
jgi:hypothetical protein